MHTLLDYDGKLPTYINITNGSVGDNKGAYNIPLQKGAVIVADRYYNDSPMLNVWDSKGVNFVIRHKNNLAFDRLEEKELPERTAQHVLKDEMIELSNKVSREKYPQKLRRVAVWDEENQQTIELIPTTSNGRLKPFPIFIKLDGRLRCFLGTLNNYYTSKHSSALLKTQ